MRQVTHQEAMEKANLYGIPYIETSALIHNFFLIFHLFMCFIARILEIFVMEIIFWKHLIFLLI